MSGSGEEDRAQTSSATASEVEKPEEAPADAWTPAWPGQRPPFAPGHDLSTTHGAYSEARLIPLSEKVYAELRASLVSWDDAYEIPVRAVAEIRARRILAVRWLDEHGLTTAKGEVQPILKEVPKWEARERELANDLALTIRSRAALDLDRLAAMKDMVTLADIRPVLTAFARIAVFQSPPELRGETRRMLEAAAAGFVSLESEAVVDGIVVDEGS